MAFINKQDTNGTKPALTEGELGYDKQGSDRGRVYVGTNTGNVPLAEKSETDANTSAISGKQATLVSGTNIKTIGGESVLGSGDLDVGGAGAVGGGTDEVFYENDQVITTNYTLTANKNAMTAGDITINNGITVTVPNGATWTVV